MSRRSVRLVTAAMGVVATLLLMVPEVLAGDRDHAADRPSTYVQRAPAPTVPAGPMPMTVSVVVTTASQPARETLQVDLRGPNGQVRRFPVEGGRAAIRYRQIVLRPGESVTIHWVAAK